jgi:hypothetical protein
MNGPEATITENLPSRRACLVDGCSCKDARIISHRRVAYFASQAIANGETADRILPAEADWRLPTDIDIDIESSKGATR